MIISRIYKSLVRHVSDMIEELNASGAFGITYHVWEARGEEDKLPKNILVGVDGFNFHENSGLWIVRFSISLSSYQDTLLLREAEILDGIHAWFGEKQRVPLRDPETGDEDNQLVVTDFEIAPMAQTMLRNYRTVSIELKRTANDG